MRDALQPEIQSERLLLRAWRPSDAEALFALFNNWEVVRWLSGPPWPYVIDDARSYIDGAIQRSSEGTEESYAVTLHADVSAPSACDFGRPATCSVRPGRTLAIGLDSLIGDAAT